MESYINRPRVHTLLLGTRSRTLGRSTMQVEHSTSRSTQYSTVLDTPFTVLDYYAT